MTNPIFLQRLNRRSFLKLGGGVLAAALGTQIFSRGWFQPEAVATAAGSDPNIHVVGTDGWASLPDNVTTSTYFPDNYAPAPRNTYMFGFRALPAIFKPGNPVVLPPIPTSAMLAAARMGATTPAPSFFMDESNSGSFLVRLYNAGLAQRPDLVDAHTIHWHGFRNAIPYYDGEPTGSIAVPINRNLTYAFRPQVAGTYMYHCHFEDTEHVHMGMTGMVFIRASQDSGGAAGVDPFRGIIKHAYNNGSTSPDTSYDREYNMLLTEVWAESHWKDSHIQLPEWSEYQPDFYLLNGRCYPDTLLPAVDPDTADPDTERLSHQPLTSLVNANAGERVLLRFVNLGFEVQTMTLSGIPMHVIAKDATLLRGQDGTDLSFRTSSIKIGPGESVDVIFTAPAYVSDPQGYNTYLLYNRNLNRLRNEGGKGFGGQMTEIRVYPNTTGALGVPPQNIDANGVNHTPDPVTV